MSAHGWITSTLILVPFGGALLLWLIPMPRVWIAPTALLISLFEIGFWIEAVARFDFGKGGLQESTKVQWFKDLGVSYHVGMFEGFSLWLVGLAVIVMAAAIAYGYWVGRDKPRAYYGLMLFLTGAIVGVFTAQDLLLFYVFWEAMLIPLYVLIGVWGGPRRMEATIKFVIYTMVGSLLMLAAVIVYGLQAGTFSMIDGGTNASDWIFLGFAAAFIVKAPLFPFHGWLPDAYRESPAEVSSVLSGVVSKAAAFGFLRICFSLFPTAVHDFRTPILVLAAVGLVYGSLLAFRAPDIRGVIAYSSLAQLGLITLGLFATNSLGIDGAVLQMVNHGLISAVLFMLAGAVERRTATGQFDALGGMARGRPALATVLMTTGIIALAVPGSTAFAGEFAILAGVFQTGWGYAVVGAIAIVLAAMYVLRMISAVLHTSPGPAVHEGALDLRPGELAILVPLVAVLLFLSAWPASITDRVDNAEQLVDATGGRQVIAAVTRPPVDWFAISPSLALLAAAGACLLVAVLVPRAGRRLTAASIGAGGFVTAFVLAVLVYDRTPAGENVIADAVRRDRFFALGAIIVAAVGLVAVLVSYDERTEGHMAEYYALLTAAGGGMMFLLQANNLMTLFLGLEWFSISLYILCAIDYGRERSLEAGLKYLVVGGFGSAVLLFGSALVYGSTGELSFQGIAQAVAANGLAHDQMLLIGLALIIVGLGFKASAAPFHMWTPDVYEGAPTSVTGFMAAATKVAALMLTLRILNTAFPQEADLWTIAIAVIACASLAIGNLAALTQRSVKRLLAYSSISHAGFMLIAIAAHNALGARALVYYLIPYSAMSLGSFAVVAARERELGKPVQLDDLAGMGWERPLLGAGMWTFMLGFAGLPPTGGFLGKFYVFSAAYERGWLWLVIVGIAATAVSLYYYLAVIRALYMRPAAELQFAAGGSPPPQPLLQAGTLVCMVVTVGSFFVVQPLIDLARHAVESL